MLVLLGLSVPFVLQQSFYPFFRFGMFAEPVKRDIQQEIFLLGGMRANGDTDMEISSYTEISKSNLNYLLRNYYYRNETQEFLDKAARLLPASHPYDTIFMIRIMAQDTSIVARRPL